MRTYLKTLFTVLLLILTGVNTAQAQQQCTAFETKVTCDESTGRWNVLFSNTAQSQFAPNTLQISTADPNLTLHQDANDPLNVNIEGANAGDTLTLSVNGIEHGAGGADGLDLCCMGDVEVTIPEGQACEAPPPDRTLEVSKVCEPLGYTDNFGSNVECTFTVNYSGPPPTPQNPISVTDTLASGGPMTINSHWPPSGINAWDCTPEPSAGPYTCEMHTGIDTTNTAGYWNAYTTSFTVQAAMPEPYRNCAEAGVETATGASVTDENCHQEGDFDLIVEKVLADEHGGICLPGETCSFDIIVTNIGSDPYVGDITLSDEVTLTGSSNSGSLTSITPPVCTIAELTSTGCTTGVNLNASQSTTFSVDYTVPAALGPDVTGGENCVALTDATMEPFEDPQDIDVHFSCAPFSIEEPKIRVEKDFVDGTSTCSAGSPCDFTITIYNDGTAPYTGPVAIRDTDTPGGMVISAVSPPVCLPAPTATPFDCTANVTVPAGGSQVLTFSAFMPLMPVTADAPNMLENCVDSAVSTAEPANWPADLFQTENRNCAQVSYCAYACHSPPEVTDNLTITKSLLNAEKCLPGEICTYKIDVANLSTGPVTGVIMLEEHLPTGALVAGVRALPWSCGPAVGGVAPCVHPMTTLAPGDVTSFEIDVAIPADFAGAQIANCAGFPGDSSPINAARSAQKASVRGPASLFARADGYGVKELGAYLQIRGLPAAQAMQKAESHSGVRENGAVRKGAKEMSCAVKSLREEAMIDLEKSCEVIEGPTVLVEIICEVSMTVTGASEGDQIDLTDKLNGIGTEASIEASPWFDGTLNTMPCIADDANAETTCVIPVTADMANGDPFVFSGKIVVDPYKQGAVLENCVDASLRSDASVIGNVCETINLPDNTVPKIDVVNDKDEDDVVPTHTGAPKLVLSKTASGACVVNKAAQQYECGFDIEAMNAGDAPLSAPIAITDLFKTEPKPRKFALDSGDGWSCLRATKDAASCAYAGDDLAAGASSTMEISVILPGLRDGGAFTNCAQASIPEDDFLRTQLAQKIMKEAGLKVAVDGSYGPQTRRAVIATQQRLGIEQTGVIDDALFDALGLSGAGVEEACATVELLPMPEIICPKGQRKNSRGTCYTPEKKCRKGQIKTAAGECVTPKVTCKQGQKKNSKGKCYWPKCPSGQARNSSGQCYVVDTGPSCDARTTVARNGECACRYKNMRRVNASRCSCKSGIPPVRGVGCVNVSIGVTGGGGGGVEGEGSSKRCVTIAGITKCF